jgi:histone acetyltransferase 1
VKYAEKLPASTVDDVEGKLIQFLPEGACSGIMLVLLTYVRVFNFADVLCGDESEFSTRVAQEAASFVPYGNKIHSYTRSVLPASAKGKGPATQAAVDGEIVEYEVYHVCIST